VTLGTGLPASGRLATRGLVASKGTNYSFLGYQPNAQVTCSEARRVLCFSFDSCLAAATLKMAAFWVAAGCSHQSGWWRKQVHWNSGKRLPGCAAQQPRRQPSSPLIQFDDSASTFPRTFVYFTVRNRQSHWSALLYSGYPRLKSRLGDQLPYLRFSWFSSVL
jgi:hypothetical protein